MITLYTQIRLLTIKVLFHSASCLVERKYSLIMLTRFGRSLIQTRSRSRVNLTGVTGTNLLDGDFVFKRRDTNPAIVTQDDAVFAALPSNEGVVRYPIVLRSSVRSRPGGIMISQMIPWRTMVHILCLVVRAHQAESILITEQR